MIKPPFFAVLFFVLQDLMVCFAQSTVWVTIRQCYRSPCTLIVLKKYQHFCWFDPHCVDDQSVCWLNSPMLLVTVPVAQPVLQPCLSLNRLQIYIYMYTYIYIFIYRIYYIHCLLPSRAIRYCIVYIYTHSVCHDYQPVDVYIVKFYPSIYLSVYLSMCLSIYPCFILQL
jgi:hypothetical protein